MCAADMVPVFATSRKDECCCPLHPKRKGAKYLPMVARSRDCRRCGAPATFPPAAWHAGCLPNPSVTIVWFPERDSRPVACGQTGAIPDAEC